MTRLTDEARGILGQLVRALFVPLEFIGSVHFTINYRDRVAGKVTVAHKGDVKAMRTVDNIARKEK